MSQQNDDGLWRSEWYGNLKQGAAMTAFILYALPPDCMDDKSRLQDAVDALVPEIRKNGYVANADGPDYSNYGSAMLLTGSARHGLFLPDEIVDQLVQFLVTSQLDEEEGYTSAKVDFGGWDLSGWMTGNRPTTGTNISVSTSVVEALASFPDKPGVAEALSRANTWVARVQNRKADGGFHFHPKQDHDGNKAGWSDGNDRTQTRSYGSTTADGVRILHALGLSLDDPPLATALKWLDEHKELATVPGFDHESGESSWAYGLRYYYYQSLSQCLALLEKEDARRVAETISKTLAAEQNDDGSWTNPNARMREDDPLIATGFAVIALQKCEEFLYRE